MRTQHTGTRAALAAALAVALHAGSAAAAVTAAPGWAVSTIPTPGPVQGGVVRVGDAILVGQGTFGAGAQSVIRLENGVATTIATGFNSLGGFDIQPLSDFLWLVDNGGELPGAATGDTLFGIPAAFTRTTPVAAAAATLAPAGSIPAAADVTVPLVGPILVSDSAGPGAGRVLQVGGGVATPVITGLDYVAGVLVVVPNILVANVDGGFAGSVRRYNGGTVPPTPIAPLASGLSGAFGVARDNDGLVLLSGGFTPDFSSSTVVAIDGAGVVTERARGFAFSADIFHDTVRNETLVLDSGASAITVICRDADADAVCDADDACVGPVAVQKAKIQVAKAGAPVGDERVKIQGQMTVSIAPTIDPVANGARLVLAGTGGTLLDVTVPGGLYDPGTKTGWRMNGAGTAWIWKSATGIDGIDKVQVKTTPATPNRVRFKASGKLAILAIGPGDLPLSTTFAVSPAGQCGTATFPGAPAGTCTLSGATVKCR